MHIRIGGLAIHQVTALAAREMRAWQEKLEFTDLHARIAKPILTEIKKRLLFLETVGVGYLTLDRAADTLSGGELQRVRLATSIGSGLVGVCYVLDEPSIGLHPRDNDRLIAAMRNLQQQGNTVLVVEHDEGTIRAADWVVDMGPGAGSRGGRVIAQGTPQEIEQHPDSLTGAYLSGKLKIPVPETRRATNTRGTIRLVGAQTHNLKRVSVEFPLGCFVGITGVSGSGKSSLIVDTLYPAVARKLGLVAPKPGAYESLEVDPSVEQLVWIDQTPIGRSPRSCPATYSGALDEIRRVFAASRDAKQRGYSASRFSFNSAEGRCPQCQGHGTERIEMTFLSDLLIPCGTCGGQRFNRQTLQVRYKGASIADVLDFTVDAAVEFFESFSKLHRILLSLQAVGLGYLHLGQASTTLSGGEAQRIKLATELSRAESGRTLYVLDEPTTGLHFADVARLLGVLQTLVDRGNSVIIIEHNLDVIKCCDWLIDMGPDGGAAGGEVIAVGTPEQLAKQSKSCTGKYLKPLLN